MTKSVIIVTDMSKHPSTSEILKRWPSRQAVADDAGVDLFAVHRWHQRGSIPGKHDSRLLAGAEKRGICLSAQELIEARSVHADQAGHGEQSLQEAAQKNRAGAV